MVEEIETRTQKYEYALSDAVIQLALAKGKCEGVGIVSIYMCMLRVHNLYTCIQPYSEQLSHILPLNKGVTLGGTTLFSFEYPVM